MTHRVVNFSPGPAAIPLAALERARAELVDYQDTGMSIMEMSHRGKHYDAVHNEAISLLRELLDIPSDYEVLFLQGGASQQFAVVPMNFLRADQSADYLMTGVWSEKAIAEAKCYGKTRVAASTKDGERYTRVPTASEIDFDANAAYAHITTNNTIYGTQFHEYPNSGNVPLIADASSDILWRKIDVRQFGLIYAGAQKNIGPSGITVVIAKKSLIETGREDIPKIFQYRVHAKENSLYNTVPTFAVYLMRNVLAWIKQRGGLSVIEADNREKARILYDVIDTNADLYRAPVEKASRSTMNVVFSLPNEALEKAFLEGTSATGLVNLKGHRLSGGIRASIYNALSVADVQRLVDFMADFAKR